MMPRISSCASSGGEYFVCPHAVTFSDKLETRATRAERDTRCTALWDRSANPGLAVNEATITLPDA